MKLAAVRFTEKVPIPRLGAQQAFASGRDVSLDLAVSSRIVYLKVTVRGGKAVTLGIPLERVLTFEPDEKEASAKGA